jgi:hypothetical protein
MRMSRKQQNDMMLRSRLPQKCHLTQPHSLRSGMLRSVPHPLQSAHLDLQSKSCVPAQVSQRSTGMTLPLRYAPGTTLALCPAMRGTRASVVDPGNTCPGGRCRGERRDYSSGYAAHFCRIFRALGFSRFDGESNAHRWAVACSLRRFNWL